jgi:hypothetical protein
MVIFRFPRLLFFYLPRASLLTGSGLQLQILDLMRFLARTEVRFA